MDRRSRRSAHCDRVPFRWLSFNDTSGRPEPPEPQPYMENIYLSAPWLFGSCFQCYTRRQRSAETCFCRVLRPEIHSHIHHGHTEQSEQVIGSVLSSASTINIPPPIPIFPENLTAVSQLFLVSSRIPPLGFLTAEAAASIPF